VFLPINFRRIHVKLVRELEKKFGKHVLIVPQRKAIRKPRDGSSRPRGRTLAIVHDRLLEDVCYPINITGKRIRVRTDGTKFSKIQLDTKDKVAFESKTHKFSLNYKNLTGFRVIYHF
jgi:small subunit ribosomal protein S7e